MLLYLLTLQAAMYALPSPRESIDHLANTRVLFEARKFAALNELLAADQRIAESGDGARLNWALHAFKKSDVLMDVQVAAWAREAPQSWQPLLVQALRLGDSSRDARGSRWARDTTAEQFARMEVFQNELKAKCRAALATKANLGPCHAALLKAAAGEGSGFEAVAAQGFSACPKDYDLAATYLTFLAPRWGGSLGRMDQAVVAAQQRGVSAYDVSRLRNTVRVLKARDLIDAGRTAEATAIIDEGIAKEPTPLVFRDRAMANRKLTYSATALSDANEGIARSRDGWDIPPDGMVRVLVTRAWALNKLGRVAEARLDIARALAVIPDDSEVLEWATYLKVR